MEKKTNKAKSEIFKFLRESVLLQGYSPMIKLEIIMPYQQIPQKYAYQGIFACRIHICDKKTVQITMIFVKNAKKQKNE